MAKDPVLYKSGIWIAEPAKNEYYSPGEIFIRAQDDHVSVPHFLGEGNIDEIENLARLIDLVSQEMIKALRCDRVYLVSLGEDSSLGLHFRLLPRYRKDRGFLRELDPDIGKANDGLALMASWRKQSLIKEQNPDRKPFKKLVKAHKDATKKMREALHKRAMADRA